MPDRLPLVIHANDDDVGRSRVTTMLREAGFEVMEAEGGKRALDLARTVAPDLVVSAVRMRDIDGFEVCQQIRAHPATAAVPVVLLSAHLVADEHRARGLDIGADAYLAEPVAPDVLRATLLAVLRARRAEGEAGEAAARERFLFESLPVPAWVSDRESSAFLAVNDAAVKRLGYSREEFLSMSIVDLRPAEDVPALVEVLTHRHGDVTGLWRLRTKPGDLLHVELFARSIVFRDRDACLVVAEDITERQGMQAELTALKDRLAGELAEMRRLHELSTRLADVTRSVGSALDLDTVLQRVVDGAKDLCGSDVAAILVRDDDGDAFRPRARTGDAGGTRRGELRVEAGRGAGGQVIVTRQPFRTDDYLRDPRIGPDYRWVAEQSGIVAMMIVPIIVDERVEGLLYVDNRSGRPFTGEHEAVCLRLADHAAVAFQNVRLFRAERAARTEAEVLKALAVELSSTLDLGRVLERVAGAARDLCRADLVRIALREPDGAMVYRCIVGARATGYEQMRLGAGKGFVGRVLETGRPFRTDDALSDPHVHPDYGRRIIEAEGTRTAMVVPIVAGGRIEGLIYVARRTPAPFNDGDERVGSRLADHAAIAIRNAELFASERAARRDAETATQQLRLALQAGRMGIGQWTMRTGEVGWSPEMEAIYGYAPGTSPGTSESFEKLIHPDDRDRVVQAITEAVDRPRQIHIEYRIVRPDRSVRWIETHGQPLVLDADGRLVRMVGVSWDVTERKQMEERFQLAVEAAPTAMMIVNHQGTIVFVNSLTERLLGYARNEIIGQSVERLVPVRFQSRHTEHRTSFFADLRRRPMGAGRDLYAVRKDGSEVPVEIGLSPFETAGGVFILAAITDITERKQAEDERARLLAREQAARSEAEEANRAKDQFLAVLSHELRTPLNTMLGWLAVLRTGRLDPSQQERALEVVERNTRAQARMIDDLLDISRIAAGKMVLDRRPMSLGPVVADTVDALQPEAKAKGLTLERHVDPAAGTVSADADRMRQILVNLLVNAMKYTPSGGRIDVYLTAAEDVVRITVKDTGVGIEPDLLPHVFERFRQADWRTAGAQSGLGLGLAVVREIVEMHGGAVEARSDGPGRGATFSVALPASVWTSRQR